MTPGTICPSRLAVTISEEKELIGWLKSSGNQIFFLGIKIKLRV
jgi:hypothetical protein